MENFDLGDFAKEHGFGYIDRDITSQLDIGMDVLSVLTPQTAMQYKMLPWQITRGIDDEKVLTVLTSNPNALSYQTELLSFARDKADKVDFFFIEEKNINEAISKFYSISAEKDIYADHSLIVVDETTQEAEDDTLDAEALEDDNSPIVALVNTIIRTAIEKRVSDIHFEPEESGMIVKFRIDGTLIPQNQFIISEKNKKAVIARIKIMSKLDVSKKKETQDGSMTLKNNDANIDFRISIIPVMNGEKAVLRILDKNKNSLDLEKLGFEKEDVKTFVKLINKPTGIILITGPTGSGKSTTLYSFLSKLDSVAKNITTIENPVEYQLQGINQIQIEEKHISFADALRAVLRQDPNVIMLGEIRDKETAENAVQAAQTGHLVFSTLHTNDSISVLSRLKRLGIQEDAIAQTLTCVIAQRLVKRICPNCVEEYVPDFEKLGISEQDVKYLIGNGHKFVHGRGCEECDMTGYKDRITVYEYFVVDDEIRKSIENQNNVYDIKDFLKNKRKMKNMWQKGLDLVRNNITTIEEVTHEVMET